MLIKNIKSSCSFDACQMHVLPGEGCSSDVCALHVLSGEGCSSQYGLAKQAAESSEISHLHQCITRAL